MDALISMASFLFKPAPEAFENGMNPMTCPGATKEAYQRTRLWNGRRRTTEEHTNVLSSGLRDFRDFGCGHCGQGHKLQSENRNEA